MHASSAYALGFHGQGLTVGVMDSGALLSHPDLAGGRITGTHVTGTYGSTGNRYPQSVYTYIYRGQETDPAAGQPFTEGEAYDVTGDWMYGVNDTHGTHVTGTVGANRDGNEMHGVSWGSNIVVGNTGATDSNNYGPYQDYDFFYNGWKAIADQLVADNGADRGGVINNSFGTNIRVARIQKYEGGRWVTTNSMPTVAEVQAAMTGTNAGTVSAPQEGDIRINFGAHIPTNNVAQAEYEYFYHNKLNGEGNSFVDAAWDAIKGTKVVQIFTTGNRDSNNPFYRPLYPYFNPEAESQWIAVAGLRQDGDGYRLYDTFNEAGLGKWWTIAAPGARIYSTNVTGEGVPGYQNSSGTSMAAPHVAGAMGVLMSRYASMDATQVRDVMFTTANHKNPDGSDMQGWNNKDGTTPAEGEVSDAMGWGVPDLDKGMYGPGQFLGKFDYNLNATPLDVWTNDISEVALKQREREDLAWMAATNNGTDLSADYELGESFVVGDGDTDFTNHIISAEDAEQWRAEYYAKRAEAIQNKIDNDLYKGSLVKRGAGTLVMTGNNTYSGGTTVAEGTLYGFTESFGTGAVNVNGGKFGILASYRDELTQRGLLETSAAPAQKAEITVNDGGTYSVMAGQDVSVGKLVFNEGSKITVESLDHSVIEAAMAGNAQTGTVTADNAIEGGNLVVATPDYALLKTDITVDGNVLTGTLSKNEDVTLATYAVNDNARSVANALMQGSENNGARAAGASTQAGEIYSALYSATTDEARATLASLGNDLHVTANAMSLVNGTQLVRTVKDQAMGTDGSAKSAEINDGKARVWMSAVGNWSKMERSGASDMDVDFHTGLIGLETDINGSNKLGVFFGAGESKFKGHSAGKIESDDLHFGVYGQSQINPVRLSYGFAYSHQDRDSSQSYVIRDTAFGASHNYAAKVAQVYGEAAYTDLKVGNVEVEPYAGLSWMHLSADDFSDDVGVTSIKTKFENQNVVASNLGVRAKAPFKVGSVDVKAVADVNWTQFMGDTRGEAKLDLGSGTAKIKSEKLSSLATVGLGLDAQVGKNTNIGVNYYGAFGSKVKSNGVGATLKISF